MSDRLFDKSIEEKLRNYSSPFPDELWNNVHSQLVKDRNLNRLHFYLRWGSAAAVILLFLGGSYFYRDLIFHKKFMTVSSQPYVKLEKHRSLLLGGSKSMLAPHIIPRVSPVIKKRNYTKKVSRLIPVGKHQEHLRKIYSSRPSSLSEKNVFQELASVKSFSSSPKNVSFGTKAKVKKAVLKETVDQNVHLATLYSLDNTDAVMVGVKRNSIVSSERYFNPFSPISILFRNTPNAVLSSRRIFHESRSSEPIAVKLQDRVVHYSN